ncbi:MAG TPA: winged helix-turn-helix domain-containing protein, partial [Anaerolineae bacterium]|nr:winged helix-turn-helix domain-containing protein [Anaerolineae bacterium]
MPNEVAGSGSFLVHALAKRLERGTIREQIESALEEAILSGSLKPGEELPSEAQLASELGVSRIVVREAMKTLQAHGLVKVAQGKRISV